MSEVSNENDENTQRLTSHVFQTIRSETFLKQLFWDSIEDFRDKKTFKELREAMDKILNKEIANLTTLTSSKADREREKDIVASICSVAYTMDTVFSKIVFKHLEQQFKATICNIVHELRDEGKIADDVWSWLQITKHPYIENSAEVTDINSVTSTPVGVENNSCNKNNKTIENHNYATRNTEIKETPPKKRLTARRKVFTKKTASKIHASTPKKNLPRENNLSPKEASPSKQKLPEENDLSSREHPSSSNLEVKREELNIFSGKVWVEIGDSDTDSNISFGNKCKSSASSVSSVHTSDLSSFDDEISLSDEDGTKKKMSCAELLALKSCETPSKLAEKFNGTPLQKSSDSPKEITDVIIKQEVHTSSNSENEDSTTFQETPQKLPDCSSSQSPTTSISSKRRRKPNSKYNSESILCHSMKVKERKKQNVHSTADKDNSSQLTPKKKRTRIENSDTEVETPSKVQKTDIKTPVKNPTLSDVESPAKQRESPDLQKPRDSVRSLTSRRTAPVTLYSTAP